MIAAETQTETTQGTQGILQPADGHAAPTSRRPTLYDTVLSLSYADLARLTGLGRKAVSKLLQGRLTQPRVETVQKIATGLGYTVNEVLAFMARLESSPMPYRGGRVLDVETVEAIKADRDGTTREVAARHGTTAETVSKIWRFA